MPSSDPLGLFNLEMNFALRPPAALTIRDVVSDAIDATVWLSIHDTDRRRLGHNEDCEVIQMARITESDPVRGRSNRALPANFKNAVAESSTGEPHSSSNYLKDRRELAA
jgi:hypothetical protein